jgi:MoxR-like ATPase
MEEKDYFKESNILTINGHPGDGKSEKAKNIAKELNMKYAVVQCIHVEYNEFFLARIAQLKNYDLIIFRIYKITH